MSSSRGKAPTKIPRTVKERASIVLEDIRATSRYPLTVLDALAVANLLEWVVTGITPPAGTTMPSDLASARADAFWSALRAGAKVLLPERPTGDVLARIAGDGPDPWAGADPVLDALDRAPPAVDDVSPDELVEVRRRAEDVRGRP